MKPDIVATKALQVVFFTVGAVGFIFSLASSFFVYRTAPPTSSVAPALYAGLVFVVVTAFCATLGGVLFTFISAKAFRQVYTGLLITCAVADPVSFVIFARSISVNSNAIELALSEGATNDTAALASMEGTIMGIRAGGLLFSLLLSITGLSLLVLLQRFRKSGDHDDEKAMRADSVWDNIGLRDIRRAVSYGRQRTKKEIAFHNRDLELQSTYYARSAEAVKVARERRDSKLYTNTGALAASASGRGSSQEEKPGRLEKRGSTTVLTLARGGTSNALKDLTKSSRGSIIFGIEVYPKYWSDGFHFPLIRRVPVEEKKIIAGIQEAAGKALKVTKVVRLENSRTWRDYWSCRNVVGAVNIAAAVKELGEQGSRERRQTMITLRQKMEEKQAAEKGVSTPTAASSAAGPNTPQPHGAKLERQNTLGGPKGNNDEIGVSSVEFEMGQTKNMSWLTEEISVDANERYLFAIVSPADLRDVLKNGFRAASDFVEQSEEERKTRERKASRSPKAAMAEKEDDGKVLGNGFYLFSSLAPLSSRAKIRALQRFFTVALQGPGGSTSGAGEGLQVVYCRAVLGKVKTVTADASKPLLVKAAKETVEKEVGVELKSQILEGDKDTGKKEIGLGIKEKNFHSAWNLHGSLEQSRIEKEGRLDDDDDDDLLSSTSGRRGTKSGRRSTMGSKAFPGKGVIDQAASMADFFVKNPLQIYPEYVVSLELSTQLKSGK